MTALLIALNIIAGLFLVAVVLLQAGKGADMGAAFGGANPAVFGPTGQGNVLQKVTAATAVVFMGTSLALAVISARQRSIFDGSDEPAPLAAPVVVPGASGTAAVDTPEGSAGDAAAPSDDHAAADAAPEAEASPPASPPSGAAPEGAADATPPPAAAAPEAPAQPGAQ